MKSEDDEGFQGSLIPSWHGTPEPRCVVTRFSVAKKRRLCLLDAACGAGTHLPGAFFCSESPKNQDVLIDCDTWDYHSLKCDYFTDTKLVLRATCSFGGAAQVMFVDKLDYLE